MEKKYYIGIDVGGTKTFGIITDRWLNILTEYTTATKTDSAQSVVQTIEAVTKELARSISINQENITAMGIGVPGMINFIKGIVDFVPHLPIRNFPLKKVLSQKYKKIPIYIENDANLAAFGEKKAGAGQGVSNLICVTLGTGIGGGIIINNKIYRGALGCAGEIGHMVIDNRGSICECGNYGCYEAIASGQTLGEAGQKIAKRNKKSIISKLVNGKIKDITGETVVEAARRGDLEAKKKIIEISTLIGTGLANLISIFNPEMIILSGGLAKVSEIYRVARKTALKRAVPPSAKIVRIVQAKLGNKAGAIGASAFAIESQK